MRDEDFVADSDRLADRLIVALLLPLPLHAAVIVAVLFMMGLNERDGNEDEDKAGDEDGVSVSRME